MHLTKVFIGSIITIVIIVIVVAVTVPLVLRHSSSSSSDSPNSNLNTLSITPKQIRLALIPNGMTISWATDAPLDSKMVIYGLSPNSLNYSSSVGSSHSYLTASDPPSSIYFHDVFITKLQSFTVYYYQINISSSVQSPIYSFRSGLVGGDPTPFNLLMVGDMGLVNSANTINGVIHDLPSTHFVMHIGDISYADDYFLSFNITYEESWNKYQNILTPITANSPYMVLPGNHEVTCNEVFPDSCPQGQKNFTSYRHRFRMPGPESGGQTNFWFSYDYGLIHFVHINSETDFQYAPSGLSDRDIPFLKGGPIAPEGEQLNWLINDLTNANKNRDRIPWIIVSGHRPYYTTSGEPCLPCQAAFESIFNQFNVDIYFAGHLHWYERLYAISLGGNITSYNYTQATSPIYIVNGAAGSPEKHQGTRPYTAEVNRTQIYAAKIYNDDYGYGRLSLLNRTALQWDYYRATDRVLVDSVTVIKDH